MPFTEDLAAFFQPGDFASTASYVHASNAPVSVDGIFDDGYADQALGLALADRRISFLCAGSAVPSAARDDTLVIAGVTYFVRAIEPDGTGLTRLVLGLA
jgi:hypothetical protein